MLLRDLPSDILSIVLEKAADVSDGEIGNFSNALPLLAVCRQWRYLALPVVYADAYYVYESKYFQRLGRETSGPITRVPVYPCEDTNVDLIASAGCVNTVKRVHITVNCENHSYGGMSAIAKRLRKVAAVWPRVEYLGFVHTVLPEGIQKKDAQAAAKMFTGMFPAVYQLDVECLPTDDGLNGLDNLLAAGYARQLRMYKGRPAALPPGCVLERLERATVSYSGETGHCDHRIQPSTLQHLRLGIYEAVHPWNMFVGDSSSGGGGRNVVFANLKSLTLSYSDEDHHAAMAHCPQLRFPRLQSLSLLYKGSACGLLQHAVFPTQMAKLVLVATPAAFGFLCTLELPAVEQLTIKVDRGRFKPKPEALAHVCRFLSRIRDVNLELAVHCGATRLLPGLVPCTRLTSVTVYSQAAVNLVMSFVVQLQSLPKLRFTDVLICDLPADMTIAPPDAHERLEPLNTSLQTLSLAFHQTHKASEKVTLAKYLLMRLPNLTMLSVPGISEQPVLDFARKYSRLYPHLKNAKSVFRG